jgi:hypothetical protein
VAITSNATATGGSGVGGGGRALATATGTGQSGTVDAHAATKMPSGSYIDSVTADVSANVPGTIKVTAETLLADTAPSFITNVQGVAFVTAEPTAASIAPVLSANAVIASALGSPLSVLALEEVGGGYGTGATGSETTTSTTDFTALLNATDLSQDLVLGFYGGHVNGSGVIGVSLSISADGVSLVDVSFASGAAAAAYFNDNAVDVGSLAGPTFASGSLDLSVTMQVTTNTAGSGFFGGILVGG